MESEQDLREFQREYLEFLDEDVNNLEAVISIDCVPESSLFESQAVSCLSPSHAQDEHRERVKEMIRANKHRLIVSVNHLRKHSPRRCSK